MPFDARAAKLLQPGEHLTILPEHPGLRLEATATRRTWTYRYKSPIDDGMRQIKIGGWPDPFDYAAAVAEWKKLRMLRESGADPQLQKKQARQAKLAAATAEADRAYSVGDLVSDYLTNHIDKKRRPKGRKEVRRFLERHTEAIKDRPAAMMLRSEAYDLIQGMLGTPVLAGMVRQELGAAWDYGLDSGKLPENTPNWWRQVLRGKMPRSKGKKLDGEHTGAVKRALTPNELGDLVNFLPMVSVLVRDALTVYLWTGTRGAEIVNMEVTEVAIEDGDVLWWTVPKHKTKNARHANATDLRVPLLGRARDVVLRRLADANQRGVQWIFPSTVGGGEKPVEQKAVQSGVYFYQPYCKTRPESQRPRFPVSHWAPHDLRRSARTLLAGMGCPQDVAEAVLGHMLAGVVGVYNRHSYDVERLEWLTKLSARLEELASQAATRGVSPPQC